MTVKNSVLVGVALAAALGRAAPADAHPEFTALGTNRFVTAAVFESRVDVTDALLEGAISSVEDRRHLDADGDGRISDAELANAEAQLGGLGAAITVSVDGRALTGRIAVAIDLGEDRRVSDAPLVIERRASYEGAWREGARRLRLAVTREPQHLLDTEIGVVVGPRLQLAGGTDLVTFRGPRASALEERAATFELTGPPPPKRSRLPLLVAGLGLGALAVAAAVLRRRGARR
jgi:hypothetical protein